MHGKNNKKVRFFLEHSIASLTLDVVFFIPIKTTLINMAFHISYDS